MPDGTKRPICFVYRVLTQAGINYALIQNEVLSIYWTVQKLFQFLEGRIFEIASDHKPMQVLFGEFKTLRKIATEYRGGQYFDYTFKYVNGQNNVQADILSRLPVTDQLEEERGMIGFFHFVKELMPNDKN